MYLVFISGALLGHVCLCVAIINRMHGTGLPRWSLKLFDAFWYLFALGVPVAVGIWALQNEVSGLRPSWDGWSSFLAGYLVVSIVAAMAAIVLRARQVWFRPTTERLISNHTTSINVTQRIGHRPTGTWLTAAFAAIPGNEILQVDAPEKSLLLPQLDPHLDGLRLTHLSDLHFTGQLTEAFFEEMVEQANGWPADIVAITGDIIDKVKCLPWIERILSRLQSRHGVYYVLGNHDLRVRDETGLRRRLEDAGCVGVGGRWVPVNVRGRTILIAGNEYPWFRHAARLEDRPLGTSEHPQLRIGLTHTPDLLHWARRCDIDLMLAGHTHGGQVRLPVIGPVFAPSIHGTTHASGTFFVPPTLLHVSRGISGVRPLRWNCRPELARLVLRSSNSG